MLHLLLNKKGLRKSVFAMFLAMFMPIMSAIKMADGDGGGSAEDQLLVKIEGKTDEKIKVKYAEIQEEFKKITADAKSGMIDKTTFDTKVDELTQKLKEIDVEKYNAYEAKLAELTDSLKIQGDELNKLKDGGIEGGKSKSFHEYLTEITKTEDFKEFQSSNGKKKASFEMKTVSITDDYTGTSRVHITTRDPRVVDHPQIVRLNIRDLLTVAPTDMPYLAYMEVYDWDNAVKIHTENESLAESSFKLREATEKVSRIGTALPISKNMLESVTYIQSHLATRLPAMVRYNEDFQLLWGDGAGTNPTGIFNKSQDFATLINASVVGAADSVDSIESYNGGTQVIINLAANTLINNGDTMTIDNATEATYNDAHSVVVIDQKTVMITLAYVAEPDTSAWTFVINSPFKASIDAAQQIDVLKVGKTLVTQQEYSCNGFVLNPVDSTKIETLKGNDEHYLEVMRDASGILRISGVPVVETTAMPAGKFAMGDWAMAAALYEFTALNLEFSESTDEKLKNQVMAIVQEQIIFPIYNKYMFVTGDFNAAIAAISTVEDLP